MRSGRRGLGKRVVLVYEVLSLEDGRCGHCVYLFSSLLCGCLALYPRGHEGNQIDI
jgi:hypothetical protein